MMIFDLYNPYANQAVTRHYVDVIAEGIVSAGGAVEPIEKIERDKSNASRGIVVISPFDVLRARVAGYRRVLFWSQGLSAEESFMRNKSKAKFRVIKTLTKMALRRADLTFLVSKAMQDYYRDSYGVTLENAVVMPCFNEELEDAPLAEGEKPGNVFLYAGGLAPWQCFENTVELYRLIEQRVDDASLLVLVEDQERARRILEGAGVQRFELDYVSREQLTERIKDVRFGFCLREDDPVNNVATPTKLSTYVVNGIIPICSRSVVDFCNVSSGSRAVVQIAGATASDEERELIVGLCEHPLSREEVRRDFAEHFKDYYSRKTYVDAIAGQVGNLV